MGDHVVTITAGEPYRVEHPIGCAVGDCTVDLHLKTFGIPAGTDPGTYRVVVTLRGGLEWAKADD